MFFFVVIQVVILTLSGEVTEAMHILSAALLPKSPSFVKKPDFSQEVVSQTPDCSLSDTDTSFAPPRGDE